MAAAFNDNDPTNNPLSPTLPPSSPNPSLSLSSSTTTKDDAEKWRSLADNHHESCDLTKCLGKRVNGLYICQFSNMAGNIYSQYLRHCRRQGAFKTKPCRNFHGPSRYCPAGDRCAFFHGPEEKRELPQPPPPTPNVDFFGIETSEFGDGGDLTSMLNMVTPASMNGNGDNGGGSTVFRFPTAPHQHHQQQQQIHQADSVLDQLLFQVHETYQRLHKQATLSSEYLHSTTKSRLNNLEQQQQYGQQWRFNGNGLQQQQRQNGGTTESQQVEDIVAGLLQMGDNHRSPMTFQKNNNKRSVSVAERWYSAGGIINNGVGGDSGFKPTGNGTNSWERCSATNTSSSMSTSPPRNLGFASLYSPRTTTRGTTTTTTIWDRVVRQQQQHRQQHNQSHQQSGSGGGSEFNKSFHPFGESYPLKNTLMSSATGKSVNSPIADQHRQQ